MSVSEVLLSPTLDHTKLRDVEWKEPDKVRSLMSSNSFLMKVGLLDRDDQKKTLFQRAALIHDGNTSLDDIDPDTITQSLQDGDYPNWLVDLLLSRIAVTFAMVIDAARSEGLWCDSQKMEILLDHVSEPHVCRPGERGALNRAFSSGHYTVEVRLLMREKFLEEPSAGKVRVLTELLSGQRTEDF